MTLTTDFGLADWFVAAMKGVILGLQPRAVLVDIAHQIPPGDIRAGAFALAASHRFFPRGTIHVAVVDPGVGGGRRAIAARTGNYFFVGPDNGVLSLALARERVEAVHCITNARFFLHPVSTTFHGRDVFAPVAAHLSKGVPVRQLGPPVKDWIRLDWPAPRVMKNSVRGEVLYIDRFGNAITNLDGQSLGTRDKRDWHVWAGRKRLCRLGSCYQDARVGSPIAVPGSSGFLEIAINGGSAARAFRLKIGDPVTARPAPPLPRAL